MTLYHFGNCLALLYVPFHMAYKFSGISEYGSVSKCVHTGMIYVFTQLCKMLLLATFFPDTDGLHTGDYNLFLEVLKATVDYADLLGLYVALNSVSGKGSAKILTTAIGWAGAEMALSCAVPLWVGARGAEFSWSWACLAAGALPAILHAAAAAALLWARTRSSLPSHMSPVTTCLLSAIPLRALLEHAGLSPAPALLLKAVVSIVYSLAALAVYATVPQSA